MAHFRKADFDQGIGTNTVAADTEEKQTVHCAEQGRRREQTIRRALSIGLSSLEMHSCWTVLRTTQFKVKGEIAIVSFRVSPVLPVFPHLLEM